MINRIARQKVLKLMMITLTVCGVLHAEQVKVTGTVKSDSGKALEGVKVTLAKTTGLSATTNAGGSFTLTNATSILKPNDLNASYGFSIKNNAIVFTSIFEKVSGTLALFSTNGKRIASVTLNNLQPGQQCVALPKLSSGTYVLAGTLDGKSFTRSLAITGNDRMRSKAAAKVDNNKSLTLRKIAATTAIVDTLVISKDGFKTQKWPLSSFSKDSIKLVLRDTTKKPIVYMTKKLDKAAILAIYKAIGYDLPGQIMVKVHTGEKNGTQDGQFYIKPERLSTLVNQVNGKIVETTLGFTANGFFRTTPALTLQLSKDHGYDTIGQGIDILDTDGEMTLTVTGGTQMQGKNYVGANFAKYQSSLVISHFKGHGTVGFGGAIKNMGMGFASPAGKGYIHSGGKVKGSGMTNWTQDKLAVNKAMVEAAKSVQDALGGNLVYINTVDKLTVECDCDVSMGQKASDMDDIGILGSLDPIAIDQASYDLVMAAPKGTDVKARISDTKLKGIDGLKYGETLGMGKISYTLVNIDN